MMDWKEKYSIGSQWECRDGSRAVVVQHWKNTFSCWLSIRDYAQEYKSNGEWKDRSELLIDSFDLIKPWKEPKVFEHEVVMVETSRGEIHGYLERYYNFKKMEVGAKIIARKKITITEGEGMDD